MTDPGERFWSKVNKTEACWLWTGALSHGYGSYWVGGRSGRSVRAHRLAYEERGLCTSCGNGGRITSEIRRRYAIFTRSLSSYLRRSPSKDKSVFARWSHQAVPNVWHRALFNWRWICELPNTISQRQFRATDSALPKHNAHLSELRTLTLFQRDPVGARRSGRCYTGQVVNRDYRRHQRVSSLIVYGYGFCAANMGATNQSCRAESN